MDTVNEFTIDRNTWLRGEGGDESRLLRPEDDKQCCIGFYALACGLKREQILDLMVIQNLGRNRDTEPTIPNQMLWLVDQKDHSSSSSAAHLLMVANDRKFFLPEPQSEVAIETRREGIIRTLFAEQGIAVEFIN